MLKKWLREPLLHFLLIGAALFVLYSVQNDGFTDQNKRIIFTKADTQRMVLLWEKKRQRPPTQLELNGLIEQQIREQVMYREALAMGLDQNDSIVRRRLAQKVEFISADLAAQVEPSETDLADYLASHPDMFEIPDRVSFMQVYLSTDKRGSQAQTDASQLLTQFLDAGPEIDITQAGDPFMFGQKQGQLTRQGVARIFGKDFTDKLFTLPVGSWQGPIQSSYGLHLVRIDNKTAALHPELQSVRDKVRTEWMNQQRHTIDKAFYQSLRQRYKIVIEDPSLSDTMNIARQKSTVVSSR